MAGRWHALIASLAVKLIVVGALAAGAVWAIREFREPFATQISEKAALSVLRSEALSFLVTRRTVTQIVVEYNQSQWFGDWEGVLWATVTWRWGVDLTKVKDGDVRRDGNAIVCRLPEPELLDFSVDPASMGFMSKSTAIPKIMDVFGNASQRKVMEERLRVQTLKFAADQKLCPTRQEILRQLNEATAKVKIACGVEIRFE